MKEDFGAYMAKILFEIIEQGPKSPMASSLMVTPPFVNYQRFQADPAHRLFRRRFRACL